MFCGSGGLKSKLAKAAGAEPSGPMRDQELHTAVARSTLRSQNGETTSVSGHFWKLDMIGGQGAGFLTEPAFWSIRSSGLPR